MTSEWQKRRNLVISGVCDDFFEQMTGASSELRSDLQERLKLSLSSKLDQHIKPGFESAMATAMAPAQPEIGKAVVGGSRGTNAMLIAWGDWKLKNDDKKKYDGASAWDYWKKEIWNKVTDEEKKKYQERANEQKASQAGKTVNKEARKTPGVSSFKLFMKKHETLFSKEEKFIDPASNTKVGGYILVRSIWTNYAKTNAEILQAYEKLKKEIETGETDADKGLARLPHLDIDQLRAGLSAYDSAKFID